MATGLDLVRMPGFAFPENAKLDFTPLRQALQHRTEMGFRQSQEERELERLGLDRQRFGLQERQLEQQTAHQQRQLDLQSRGLDLQGRGLDLQGRSVGVQEGQLGIQQTAAQREEERQQAIRMANEAWRIRQQHSDPAARAGALSRFVTSSPILSEYLRRQGLTVGADADQIINHLISQVPDATERYRPTPLVAAPPGHTLGRQTPEGGFEAVYTAPTQLSQGDRRAVDEADAGVSSARSALGLIDRALELNPQAYTGIGALRRAEVGRHAPSLEYNVLITQQMLSQLRATFVGAQSDGEREVLQQVQGSLHLPIAVRERILRRAQALVQERERSARERAAAIRAGTYYQPGGGQPPPSGQQPAPPPGGGQPVRITSDAEFNALPSGTRFIGPDGRVRVKP